LTARRERVSGFQGGLPAIGEELARVDVGFGGDSKERIAEVAEGVDAVAFGALDKGVVDGGGAASAVVSQEERKRPVKHRWLTARRERVSGFQ